MIPVILFLTIIVMAKSEYRSVLYTCTFSNPSKLDQFLLSIQYIGPVLHKHILRFRNGLLSELLPTHSPLSPALEVQVEKALRKGYILTDLTTCLGSGC